ncbi:MAG TPA: hypothetical protein VEF03_00210 [Candidatus Binataceae bacterium]|nr:hypothetical protein [Candidatus Binataceae bacterium]
MRAGRKLRFRLKPVAPFRLDFTAWALRRRPHNQIDLFDNGTYRRTLSVGPICTSVAIRQTRGCENPEIEVVAGGHRSIRDLRREVESTIIRMLGLDRDLSDFYRVARADRRLSKLAERLRGFKPVRFPTNFEAFTNAVACQLVSLTAGLHVVNRIAARYGRIVGEDDSRSRAFPDASAIAAASADDLRTLGLSRSKGRYLIGIAEQASRASDRDFASIQELDDKAAADALCAMPGVGRWTAEYVMLRGFGRVDIFPGDDVGGRNSLCKWLEIDPNIGYEDVRRLMRPWSDWGGLVYMHLLVAALADRGVV